MLQLKEPFIVNRKSNSKSPQFLLLSKELKYINNANNKDIFAIYKESSEQTKAKTPILREGS